MKRFFGRGTALFLMICFLLAPLSACDSSLASVTDSDPGQTSAADPAHTEELPSETEAPGPALGNPSVFGYASTGSDSLPTISIQTENGAPILSREDYLSAAFSAEGTTDDSRFGFQSLPGEVRCRGNYTYTGTEKKSYRLKFADKINLFGQGSGPARSWVLLAEHCDQSFLRNHLAFAMASKLSHISYVSSSSFVKLYINGTYQGIYHLAEQHQVGTYRVNIQEDPGVVDTDYFIERDSYADEDGNVEGLNYFRVNRTKYLVKSDDMSGEKCEFLREFFQNAHDAISEGDRRKVERYVDLDSLVDTYLLQVLMKNTDVGYSSFFMVKKAKGKIYFTCPWDFDLALGNDKRLDNGSPEGLYTGVKYGMMQEHEWFYLLFNQKWFCNLVRARWNEVKEDLYAVRLEIDRITEHFGEDMATNFEVWPFPNRPVNQEPTGVLKNRTYPEHTAYLKKWFEQRYAYLDELFNSDEIYEQGGTESWHWWEWGW